MIPGRPAKLRALKTPLLAAGAVVLVLAACLLSRRVGAYPVQIAVFMGCNVILAVSLNLVNGHTGQFSIGHAGFMALGAYTAASISVNHGATWLEPWEGSPLRGPVVTLYMVGLMLPAGLVAAVGGLLVGLPSLRLRGDYLAIATLGFGEIIRVILLNVDAVGGARGLPGIPRYSGLPLVLIVAVVITLALRNLVASAHGRALEAIREDETAAEALGVDCSRAKTVAFVVAAFCAGVAGCLYAHHLQFIHPRSFDFMKSIELVLMVVLGGGTFSGAAVAAVALTVLPEGLRAVKDLLHLSADPRMVIYAVALIAAMLLRGRRQGRMGRRRPKAGGDLG